MRDHHRGHSFASVLGRIFVLLAIITGVPVMMWTITAFMRAYVAQPVIPGPQRLSPAFADAPAPPTADTATTGPAPTAQYADTRASGADVQDASADGRTDRSVDNGGNAALPPASLANAAVAALTRAAAPTAAGAVPSAAALPPQDNGAMQMPPAPPPAFAPARSQDFTSTLASRHGPVIEPPTPPDIAADEQLPPPHPLRGPVPLPPRRPNIIASAGAAAAPGAAGAIPLPRGRPAAAPPPAPTAPELPPSNYDSAGMTHY